MSQIPREMINSERVVVNLFFSFNFSHGPHLNRAVESARKTALTQYLTSPAANSLSFLGGAGGEEDEEEASPVVTKCRRSFCRNG